MLARPISVDRVRWTHSRIAGLRNQYVWPLTARILHSLPGKFCPVIPEQIAKTGIFREKKVNNFKARDKGQSLGKGEAVSSILTSSSSQ